LSFSSEKTQQPSRRSIVEFGVDIVDDHRKTFTPLLFNLGKRSQAERCSNHLALAGTQDVSDGSTCGPQAQIMAVWTVTGKARLTVPRPRLIIPLSVQIFHLFLGIFRTTPRFSAIPNFDLGEALFPYFSIHLGETLRKHRHPPLTPDNDPGRSDRETILPGLYLGIFRTADKGSIALAQRPAVFAECIEKWRLEQEDEAIKQGPSTLRTPTNQLSIRPGDCEYRKDLKILLCADLASIQEKLPAQGRADFDHLLETPRREAIRDTSSEVKNAFPVAGSLTERGRSERPKIAKHDNRFQKTRLTGAVASQHEVGARTQYDRPAFEVSKPTDRELGQFHRHPLQKRSDNAGKRSGLWQQNLGSSVEEKVGSLTVAWA